MKRACAMMAAVAGLSMFLFGCETLVSGENDLVVGYGIMKLTEEAVKGDPAKAAEVQKIASQVREAASGAEFASVDLLMEEVSSHIPWSKLSPADTYFAGEVLKLWRQDLINRFGDGTLPENLRLSVEKVTGWVMLAAQP